ncbi:MAG: thiamine-phosphate kinase [Burkholderiales bacterium]
MGEFDLIARYFTRPTRRAALGVGDDCALWIPQPGQQLAISSDMLVEGRHFLSTVDPARLGHKALAVNLSDLAACGARPAAFTLALALPRADPVFLQGFSEGLWALAEAHRCELIGGDTTQGPLNICITVFGEVAPGQALLRSGAQLGDDIYVSGTVGDARLALEVFRGSLHVHGTEFNEVRRAMETPEPRVALGQALVGLVHSAVDVSDGLLGDLTHILNRSQVGARVNVDAVPRSGVLRRQPVAIQKLCTLAGGDDYELVFTAPSSAAPRLQTLARELNLPLTRIGHIEAQPGLRLVDEQGQAVDNHFSSFDHFRETHGAP